MGKYRYNIMNVVIKYVTYTKMEQIKDKTRFSYGSNIASASNHNFSRPPPDVARRRRELQLTCAPVDVSSVGSEVGWWM